jgi:hypothetical protein
MSSTPVKIHKSQKIKNESTPYSALNNIKNAAKLKNEILFKMNYQYFLNVKVDNKEGNMKVNNAKPPLKMLNTESIKKIKSIISKKQKKDGKTGGMFVLKKDLLIHNLYEKNKNPDDFPNNKMSESSSKIIKTFKNVKISSNNNKGEYQEHVRKIEHTLYNLISPIEAIRNREKVGRNNFINIEKVSSLDQPQLKTFLNIRNFPNNKRESTPLKQMKKSESSQNYKTGRFNPTFQNPLSKSKGMKLETSRSILRLTKNNFFKKEEVFEKDNTKAQIPRINSCSTKLITARINKPASLITSRDSVSELLALTNFNSSPSMTLVNQISTSKFKNTSVNTAESYQIESKFSSYREKDSYSNKNKKFTAAINNKHQKNNENRPILKLIKRSFNNKMPLISPTNMDKYNLITNVSNLTPWDE